jgi:hypothetical protein
MSEEEAIKHSVAESSKIINTTSTGAPEVPEKESTVLNRILDTDNELSRAAAINTTFEDVGKLLRPSEIAFMETSLHVAQMSDIHKKDYLQRLLSNKSKLLADMTPLQYLNFHLIKKSCDLTTIPGLHSNYCWITTFKVVVMEFLLAENIHVSFQKYAEELHRSLCSLFTLSFAGYLSSNNSDPARCIITDILCKECYFTKAPSSNANKLKSAIGM